MITETMTPEPVVRLENYFQDPYNLSVATARTCYSSKVISSEDVDKDEQAKLQRDRIAESIYQAGHHTTIQHPTFQFVLEKVSRQCIWSFLHAHPFYNCLAGETEIPHFHVANKAPWTIAELYQRLHSSDKHMYVEKMHIRSVDDEGNLVPNRIKDVLATGRQQVFKVTTALGYTIRATSQHRFMQEDQSWARLHELSVGHTILVNGVRVYCSLCHKAAESPHRSIMRVTIDRIVSIEADGEAETYDLVMEAPYHNFVANGFIVHNSEQVSQRYVEVKPENFTVPPLEESARRVYLDTVRFQMEAYHQLAELVEPTVLAEYRRLFPARDLADKRWRGAIKKRCQEVARYVLPVATHAHLYHTISGITLHRYWRLCQQFDAPLEQRLVVQKMVEEVSKVDPKFMRLAEDPLPLEATLEYKLFHELHRPPVNGTGPAHSNGTAGGAGKAFVDEFDQSLGEGTSKLIDASARAQETMAQAVRSVLGLPAGQLPDEQALDLVLNPAKNPYLSDALTLTTMSKLTRTMVHPHFTFRKKLSHTADSQDQRHRMVPASRPVLMTHFIAGQPDVIVPALVKATPEALAFYHEAAARVWQAIGTLLDGGVDPEFALYLLPNAFPIRFEESGDLLHFHHKWVQRLCYTAQEEIWNTCREEVIQVKERFPLIGCYLQAPCWPRSQAGITPHCPEGDRFCGVAVWKQPVEAYRRLI